ncbi:hypothetical protein [Helicobacter phage Pt4481G]|nr:hypothetical protein [Helicobacter phage Pt4481G]
MGFLSGYNGVLGNFLRSISLFSNTCIIIILNHFNYNLSKNQA